MVGENLEATDASALEAALKKSVEFISAQRPDLPRLEEFERARALDGLIEQASSPVAEFSKAVRSYSGFGYLRDGWWNLPNMGYVAQAHAIVYYLIFKALSGSPARALIVDLERLATERGCEAQWLAAIAGATIDKRVAIGTNAELLPWTEVPEGMQKNVFSGKARSSYGFNPMVSIAGCAISLRFQLPDLVLPANPGDGGIAARSAQQERWIAIAQDVVRCMTATGKRGPAITGYWIVLGNKAAEELTGDGYSFTPAFSSPLRSASVPYDSEKLEELYRGLGKLDGSELAAMRIALDRLNTAQHESALVDRAIDLGIALEVLMMHQGSTTEIAYKAAVRGAAFLQQTLDERRKTFALLRDIYELRSRGVHTGRLEPTKKIKDPATRLSEGVTAAAEIARKVIERGSFPDWEDEYVLNPKPASS